MNEDSFKYRKDFNLYKNSINEEAIKEYLKEN